MASETVDKFTGRYPPPITGQNPLIATCTVQIGSASAGNRTYNIPQTRLSPCLYAATQSIKFKWGVVVPFIRNQKWIDAPKLWTMNLASTMQNIKLTYLKLGLFHEYSVCIIYILRLSNRIKATIETTALCGSPGTRELIIYIYNNTIYNNNNTIYSIYNNTANKFS